MLTSEDVHFRIRISCPHHREIKLVDDGNPQLVTEYHLSTVMGSILCAVPIYTRLIVVTLAAELLQLAANISTSYGDSLLSPPWLVSLYTLSSILVTIAILWDSHSAKRWADKGNFVRVRDWGVGTDDLNSVSGPIHRSADHQGLISDAQV